MGAAIESKTANFILFLELLVFVGEEKAIKEPRKDRPPAELRLDYALP